MYQRACGGFARGLVVLILALSACGSPSPSTPKPAAAAAPASPAPDPWGQFAERFIESYLRANPFFAVQAGRHEFDGQMPDWSAAALAAEAARLHTLRNEAQAFDPASLGERAQLEREIVLTVIDGNLFWLERAQSPFTNPAWYLEQLDPDVYLNRDYAPLATRMRGYIGYLHAIPRLTADIRTNLRTPLPPSFVQRGMDDFGGYVEFLRKDGPQVFAAVQDDAAQKQLAEASTAAADAMAQLRTWFQGERVRATGRFAFGEPLFLEMLRATERVEVPTAQLLEVGRADLERNTQALRSACAQFLPGGSLRACVERMRSHKPSGGAVEGARAQLEKLRDFILANKILTVPSDERPKVAEAPPYNRSNAAYINVPGPFDKGVASVFNIAPPDPRWSAQERADYIPGRATLLSTSVHEVWPGHFLQFLYSNRNPSKVAALWVGYAYAEGWAHYCEEMMWEQGLGEGDAEQHVGQLTDALLRNVRFLSAIGLHTGGMTLAESDRMFRERAYTDPGNARQQAARGTYDPEYLKYTLGKLMIRKLRADWTARQAGAGGDPRQYWAAFHDRFLSYGGPPIPLVRKAMVGEGGSLF
ncbi:MAG: DUF885 domain-containing protein [Sinobacteraceae bacterium]|nr:DUF885 domain-containing protein [Nevskiaceae bacterium]MBV9315843.1 DUF885 domain-containing protein [Gammaproteobacteria bacterium]